MKIKLGMFLALLGLLILPPTVFAASFEPYISYATGSRPEAVAVGDVNGDGKNDVVMTTSAYFDPANDYKLFVFLQNSAGQLDTPIKYPVSGDPASVAIGDMNNDGKQDVAVGNKSNIQVFNQNQAGGLEAGVVYNTTNSLSIETGDFNHDGLLDVAGIGWGTGTVTVFCQNSTGSLGMPVTYAVQHGGYDELEAGDVNNDGWTDLIVMSGQTYAIPNLGILYQQANGFSQPASYRVGQSINTHGVAVGDINDDQLTDVIVSYGGNQPTAYLGTFNQNAQGTLDAVVNYAAYDCPEAVAAADVNADGRTDVLVLNGGWNALSLYLQDTNGNYLQAYSRYVIPYASHYNPQGLAVGDFNSDGQADVAIADYNQGLVILYNHNDAVVPVTGISMNMTEDILTVGETLALRASITPADASNQILQWTSSNPAVATVDSTGQATALAPGPAIITADTTDGSELSASCLVTVEAAYVAVGGVMLENVIDSMDVNATHQLKAMIMPANATNQAVTWSSSDSAIATVTSTGLVKALSLGTAALTVTTADGSHTATCLVTVKAVEAAVKGVTLSSSSVSLPVNGKVLLTASIQPTNAANQAVTWTSSNSSIAAVTGSGLDGVVRAIKPGTATITVKTIDGGYTATCEVIVKKLPRK